MYKLLVLTRDQSSRSTAPGFKPPPTFYRPYRSPESGTSRSWRLFCRQFDGRVCLQIIAIKGVVEKRNFLNTFIQVAHSWGQITNGFLSVRECEKLLSPPTDVNRVVYAYSTTRHVDQIALSGDKVLQSAAERTRRMLSRWRCEMATNA